MALEIDAQPGRVTVRIGQQLGGEIAMAEPGNILHLSRIKTGEMRSGGECAAETVHQLVLEQARADWRGIFDNGELLQRHGKSKLLLQAPAGACRRALSPTRMRTAAVRPKPAGMVLGLGPLLEQ